MPDYPEMIFADQAAWSGWLAENHATSKGVTLLFARKGSGKTTVTYAEALEEALRYGWIDGRARPRTDDYTGQWWTPRARKSVWGKLNVQRAEGLIAAGRMLPPGMAEIERAKADGRWAAAYDPPSTAKVPDDLAAALAASSAAEAAFKGLDSRNRYACLHRIQTAVKPETRAKRIAAIVDMLARGEVFYPKR